MYIAWASHGDNGNYHGWIMGYDASDMNVQRYVFSVSQDDANIDNTRGLGALWTGGGGRMGHFDPSTDNVLQEFQGFARQLRSGPVYWNSPVTGPTIYLWSGGGDPARAYQLQNGHVNTTPVSVTANTSGNGSLSISSNGSTAGTGILWAAASNGALHAYDASNLGNELWNSGQNQGRDGLGSTAKWVPPTVANGVVYMASSSGAVFAYGRLGLLPPPAPNNLVAIPGDGRVSLAWNPSSGTTNYTVLRGASPDAAAATPIANGIQAGGFVDNTVTNGVKYFYAVTASSASGAVSDPSNEISATPGTPVTGMPVYQVRGGGGAASPFVADQFFTGGGAGAPVNDPISTVGVIDPAPVPVYQTEHNSGQFTYTFPNLTPNAPYLVRLHFAEIFFSQPGQRLFNVAVNGIPLLTNFDIVALRRRKGHCPCRSGNYERHCCRQHRSLFYIRHCKPTQNQRH
ncbi:MAG TPA: malectin domain-containing carbohydrate-binding protein [Bryobacteraceae bacterium]|nr:malectin domain-containing carbohydrate-binding protein [Bryobacteraceae bacterium]